MLYFFLRYRIISRTAPRMAAKYSFGAEPYTFNNPVDLNRLYHILRTSRAVTAASGAKRRYKILVESNRQNQQLFHRKYFLV